MSEPHAGCVCILKRTNRPYCESVPVTVCTTHELVNTFIHKEMAKLKTHTLESLTDKYIGKRGTVRREVFEYELRLDLLGQAVRDARKKRNLTQEELGRLVGVQKAQISKIENSTKDVRLETVMKVFAALNAQVSFVVKLA